MQWPLRHRGVNHLAQRGVHGWIQTRCRRWNLLHDPRTDFIGCAAIEWSSSCQSFETHHAERKHIGCRRHWSPLELFGRHVVQCALGSDCFGAHKVRDAEVDDLYGIVFQNEDIAGFNVSVNKIALVCSLKTATYLTNDVDRPLDSEVLR